MRFLIFLIIFTVSTMAMATECLREETLETQPEGMPSVRLIEKICYSSTTDGLVTIDVIVKGNKVQTLKTNVKADAYSLFLDTSFDINLDGAPDLAINTGDGRAGEGMHYWLFEKKKQLYIDLGKFPQLSHDKFSGHNKLFSLVSSSGRFQSIRYQYLFTDKAIKLLSILGFAPTQDGKYYEIIHFVTTPQTNRIQKNSQVIRLSASDAQKCMEGTGVCPR